MSVPDVPAILQALTDALADPQVAALVIESELEPVAGQGTVIQPPTYASADRSAGPTYAVYEGFAPERDAQGWFSSSRRGPDGRAHSVPAVVVDAVGSQANRSEEALWQARHTIGGLPGIVVAGTNLSDEAIAAILTAGKLPLDGVAEIRRLLEQASISTWTASHRHVDAWFRYAQEDGADVAAWVRDGELRHLIAGANSTRDATTAFTYFVNALVFGFWLSSGVVERNRQARIYSSEIVGYDARPASAGASKYERLPVSNRLETADTADGFSSTPKASVAKGKQPSTRGFGMIPGSATPKGFVCEAILRRASVSFSALRAIRFGDDGATKTQAAGAVLTSLALLGHHLSSLQTNLRSGCDLVTVETHVGLRRAGVRAPEEVSVPLATDTLTELVRLSLRQAADAGLEFAEPIQTTMSASEVRQVVLSAALGLQAGDES
ncbi:hypothetical protein Xcel_2874 [Xylanimonas cellulosilytica DSM 15894]|uniref:Type I-U CRISPR-associated protein Cas7 n=1 Tax=Xylanimonas cellulosilytica (strain DSM 15894 / JCM 12276 / CECT 5975 / KCTC 9989 / LMG 20990 / NBRC 107835 / XIL07) TaxID=446471 RepID=D1BYL5_XYLCX|nr:type I-U CRISPR-associated protein Cas7 [Xylanimonas cellulosilytica]ACZ31887.1 hypothetical protein Xcel_2874 [Xylanimonas cellulosilytica DSM 15894]